MPDELNPYPGTLKQHTVVPANDDFAKMVNLYRKMEAPAVEVDEQGWIEDICKDLFPDDVRDGAGNMVMPSPHTVDKRLKASSAIRNDLLKMFERRDMERASREELLDRIKAALLANQASLPQALMDILNELEQL